MILLTHSPIPHCKCFVSDFVIVLFYWFIQPPTENGDEKSKLLKT